jgi:hypothetical protein
VSEGSDMSQRVTLAPIDRMRPLRSLPFQHQRLDAGRHVAEDCGGGTGDHDSCRVLNATWSPTVRPA